MNICLEPKDIIGKTILALKGNKNKYGQKPVLVSYIVLEGIRDFVISVEEQDYYSYHDCSTSAKEWGKLVVSREQYDNIMVLPDASYF